MPTFLTFVLRLFMLAAGLVLAASLAAAGVVMFALWGARALWGRLTGQPVAPFVVRVDPRGGFGRMYQRADPASRTPRADAIRPGRPPADVTDVEPKGVAD